MKFISYISLFIIASFFNISEGYSQDKSNSTKTNSVFLGYPAFIFDAPDLGIYLGYSLEFVKKDRFSWEGQVSASYSSFERDDNNFGHDGGSTVVGNLLFGPRIYVMKPEKSTRLYFSFLPGISVVNDKEYRNDGVSQGEFLGEETFVSLGYSVGSYLQFKEKFILGAAYEQYGSLVFKIGYKL